MFFSCWTWEVLCEAGYFMWTGRTITAVIHFSFSPAKTTEPTHSGSIGMQCRASPVISMNSVGVKGNREGIESMNMCCLQWLWWEQAHTTPTVMPKFRLHSFAILHGSHQFGVACHEPQLYLTLKGKKKKKIRKKAYFLFFVVLVCLGFWVFFSNFK